MGLIVDEVTADADFPTETAVVVIGGGIVGTSTALFLARKGVPVVLCEKGHIAGEQSSRNWGWIITCGRDDREIPISVLAARLWGEMTGMVEADIGYRATGIARLYDSDAPIAVAEAWCRGRPRRASTPASSPAREVATLFPGATRPFKGGLFAEGDAVAEPQRAASAIARAAQRKGARILTNCAVRALDTEAGRVSGVWTERGRIKADAVVLAGGAWSRLFCDSLDVRLSQLLVQASVMRTAPLSGGPLPAAVTQHYSFRRRADGGYTIGDPFNTLAPITPSSFRFMRDFTPTLRMSWRRLRPTASRFMTELRDARRRPRDAASAYEETRVNDPDPDRRFTDETRRRLIERFPIFGTVPVEQSWAGLLDVTPDAVPVISSVPSIPGFHVGTGFSGHGFTLGPGAGHVLADLATGTEPAVDVTPFSIARFSDGSRPKPQVGF